MKTKTQHTPGPWSTTWADDPLEQNRYVVDQNNMLIADCYADSDDPVGLPSPREYQENARLIAQAPRMVGILKYVYGRLPEHDTKSMAQIRAVILDATGEKLK